MQLEHIRWHAIENPLALEEIKWYFDLLTPPQGNQFDPRVIFSVSWSCDHPL